MSIARATLWLILFALFFAAPFAGTAMAYWLVFLTLLLVLASLIAGHRPWRDRSALPTAFLAVAGLQLIVALIHAAAPRELLHVLNFLPFMLFPLVLPILMRVPVADPARLLGSAGLVGAATTLVVALIAQFGLGLDRSGFGNLSPNELAEIGTLTGFLALLGLYAAPRRALSYAGPLLGLATVLVTGSRGVLLAWLAVAACSTLLLVPRRFWLPAGLGAVALAALTLAGLTLLPGDRFEVVLGLLAAPLSGAVDLDPATAARFEMWATAPGLVAASPFVGHGWGGMMPAVRAALDPAVTQGQMIARLPQMHNDLLNFTVSGGLIGLLSYLLALGAPLVLLWRGQGPLAAARRLGVLIVVVEFAVHGLSDLTIGFELGTTQFMFHLALISALLRPRQS